MGASKGLLRRLLLRLHLEEHQQQQQQLHHLQQQQQQQQLLQLHHPQLQQQQQHHLQLQQQQQQHHLRRPLELQVSHLRRPLELQFRLFSSAASSSSSSPPPNINKNPPINSSSSDFQRRRRLSAPVARKQSMREVFDRRSPSSPSSDFERACSLILARRDFSEPIEITLQNAEFPLTPNNLCLLLNRLRNPKDALRIFIFSLKTLPPFVPDRVLLDAISQFWAHERERFSVFLNILQDLPKPDFVMTPRRLTAIIRGFGWAGMVDEVLDLLSRSKSSFGFQPDFFHFSCALHICVEESRLDTAQEIFRQMEKDGCPPTYDTYHSLITGLLNAMKAKEAAQLFVEMVARSLLLPGGLPPRVVNYTTIVDALIQLGHLDQALTLLAEMNDKGYKPDCITYMEVIKALSRKGRRQALDRLLDELRLNGTLPNVLMFKNFVHHCQGEDLSFDTRQILNEMVSSLDSVAAVMVPEDRGLSDDNKETGPDAALSDYLIYSLCMYEKSTDAYELMLKMSKHSCVPTASTSLILFDALCWSCKWVEAGSVLRQMMERGYATNHKVYNSWIQGSCKAGHLDMVFNFLCDWKATGLVLDAASYNVLVDRLCGAGKLEEAKKITEEARRNDCTPDVMTYSKMISSFAKAGDLEETRKLLGEMVETGLTPFAQSFTPLVDSLCKAGKTEEALLLLDEIDAKGCNGTAGLYTIIVRAFCNAKQLPEAFKVMDKMKARGITPDAEIHKALFEGCIVTRKSKAAAQVQMK